MDCSPPGSSVHQVSQARILQGNLLNPGIEPTSPVSPALAVRFFATEPPGKHSESLTFQLSRLYLQLIKSCKPKLLSHHHEVLLELSRLTLEVLSVPLFLDFSFLSGMECWAPHVAETEKLWTHKFKLGEYVSVSWMHFPRTCIKSKSAPSKGCWICSRIMVGCPRVLLVPKQKQFPALRVGLQPALTGWGRGAGLEPPALYLSLSRRVGHAGHVSLNKAEINHTPAPA